VNFYVVTASIDPDATRHLWGSWRQRASLRDWPLVMVHNAPGAGEGVSEVEMHPHAPFIWVKHEGVLGPIPAFALGIKEAIRRGADIVCALHDDLRVDEDGWDQQVVQFFQDHSAVGLVGFGGAKGLGEDGIYTHPYSPYDLVRKDFCSNLENAEAHGRRILRPEKAACMDGFSNIMRADLASYAWYRFEFLQLIHHANDSAIGAFARRLGWDAYVLPIKCHHHGGLSAVANPKYPEWLAAQRSSDSEEWKKSHAALYEELRDVLPIRVP
jgi:hypothetical protein